MQLGVFTIEYDYTFVELCYEITVSLVRLHDPCGWLHYAF
jgi:hypothetical protein